MDRAPSLPRPGHLVEPEWRRLLDELYELLRPRGMGERRPAGCLELDFRTEAAHLEPLARGLDAAVRADSALWAGYLGLSAALDGSLFCLSWAPWLLLRLRPKQ